MFAASTPSSHNDSSAAVAKLVSAWAEAWNAHDLDAAARLVSEDVEFVTVGGQWLRGRNEFLSYHNGIHLMQMRESRWTSFAWQHVLLRDDLAVVHYEWGIAGDRDPDGTPRQPRCGLFTWLVALDGPAGRIALAHNTNLRPGLRHRLSARSAGDHSVHGASS